MTDYICFRDENYYKRCVFVPEEKVSASKVDGFVNCGSYIPKDALDTISRQHTENPEFKGIIYVGDHYSAESYYSEMKKISNQFDMPVTSRMGESSWASWHIIKPTRIDWRQEPTVFKPTPKTLEISDKFANARRNHKQKVVQDYETAITSEQFETKDKSLLFNLKASKEYNLYAEAAVVLGKTLQIEMKQNSTEQLTEKILNTARAKMEDLSRYGDFVGKSGMYANVLSILSATSKYGDQIDRFRNGNSKSCDPFIQQHSQTAISSKKHHIIE